MLTLTWRHHVVWFCTLSHQCILPATCFEDLPTFICPSELSVAWLHLQLGLANKVICTGTGGHYRRIVASRKHTTFCHHLEGQSKAKHFPAPTAMNSQSLKNSSANKQLAIAARKLSMPFLAAGSMCFPSWTLERSICRAALYTDPGN